MPILTQEFYKVSKIQKTNTYIETGTYLGDGVKSVLNEYHTIHTIELSEKWYIHNKDQFSSENNVQCHFGDSKVVLKYLLESIKEPVTIYLDAHYSGGTTAFGDEETPLIYELELLKHRLQNDIIIIDDCRLLGKSGICGVSKKHPVYPTMNYDWSSITIDSIKSQMKPEYSILENTHNRIYTTGAPDQIILTKLL